MAIIIRYYALLSMQWYLWWTSTVAAVTWSWTSCKVRGEIIRKCKCIKTHACILVHALLALSDYRTLHCHVRERGGIIP